MRILHVYRTYYPDPPGGYRKLSARYASQSSRSALKIRYLLCPPTACLPNCSTPRRESFVAARGRHQPLAIWGISAFQRFRELLRDAAVIHYHFPWPFADLLHLIGQGSVPSVMTYHSDVVRQRFLGVIYHPLMMRTLRSMSAVVATSLCTLEPVQSFPLRECETWCRLSRLASIIVPIPKRGTNAFSPSWG